MPLQIPSPMKQIPVLDVAGAKRAGQRESQQAFLSQLNVQNAMKQGVRSDQKYANYKKDRKRQEKLNQRTDRLNKVNDYLTTSKLLLESGKNINRIYEETLKSTDDKAQAQEAGQRAYTASMQELSPMIPDVMKQQDPNFNYKKMSQFIDTHTTESQRASREQTSLANQLKKSQIDLNKFKATGGTSPKEQRKNASADKKQLISMAKSIMENEGISWEEAVTTAKSRLDTINPPATPNPNEGKFQTPAGQREVAQRLARQDVTPQGEKLSEVDRQAEIQQLRDTIKQQQQELQQGQPSNTGEDASRREKVQPKTTVADAMRRREENIQGLIRPRPSVSEGKATLQNWRGGQRGGEIGQSTAYKESRLANIGKL